MLTAIRPKPKPARTIKTKKSHMKRGKKSRRQLLEAELDKMVREIVLLRDGFCVTPAPEKGHSSIRQPGHLVTRKRESIKWDLYNVSEQCSSCNLRHSLPNQWHYYDDWFISRFGEGERWRLTKDGLEHVKYSLEELEEMLGQIRLIYAKQLEDKTFRPRFSQAQILSGEWKNEENTKRLTG